MLQILLIYVATSVAGGLTLGIALGKMIHRAERRHRQHVAQLMRSRALQTVGSFAEQTRQGRRYTPGRGLTGSSPTCCSQPRPTEPECVPRPRSPPRLVEPIPTTVRDRLTAAGLSDARIQQHMTAGRVRVDGELVTDLDAPPSAGTRVVIWMG